MKICIFGDSIIWGAYDPERGGWVNCLRNYLEHKDSDNEVYNLGVSGDDTERLLKRIKVESIAREPDLIIFGIGINDSQYIESKDNPRVSLDIFERNLVQLIEIAQSFTPGIVFVGLTRVDEAKTKPTLWDSKKYYDNENIERYNSVIQSVCKKNNLPFIDMQKIINKEDLFDGLHPNSKGHEKIFLNIRDLVEDYLKDRL